MLDDLISEYTQCDARRRSVPVHTVQVHREREREKSEGEVLITWTHSRRSQKTTQRAKRPRHQDGDRT
jgi:hypothetical protein